MAVPTLLSLSRNPRYDPALLSEEISAVLIAMYALSLWFGLRTHREHMAAVDDGRPRRRKGPRRGTNAPSGTTWAGCWWPPRDRRGQRASGRRAQRRRHHPAPAGDVRGVVIVAIVGTAAEHSTALLFAHRGDMDVALGSPGSRRSRSRSWSRPSWCSSASLGVPMDLAFTRFEVVALGISVIALALNRAGRGDELAEERSCSRLRVLGLGFFFVG